jgi:glycosyltransferase involved in cell wall biosynthesis
MRNLLFIVPGLHYSGIATQVTQLARSLSRRGFHIRVATLRPGPVQNALRSFGVQVLPVSHGQRWQMRGLWDLWSQVTKAPPQWIHAWGLSGLRLASLARRRHVCPLVVSQPWHRGAPGQGLNLLDRILLRRADVVIASGAEEEECFRHQGLAPSKVVPIAPGVPVPAEPAAKTGGSHGSDTGPISVLCVGPVETHKGLTDAVWGFDVVRHLKPESRLAILGEGADLPNLRRFVHTLNLQASIYLLGARDQAAPWMRQAQVIWAPSPAGSGRLALLEAMALGRPAVAAAVPSFAGLVVNGVTGFLVPPGDKIGFARKTRLLLEDHALREQMGTAARRHVRQRFPAERFLEEHAQLYQRLIG